MEETKRIKKGMAVNLLRLEQVERTTGLKKSAIYAKIKNNEFPTAVRLGSRAVAWRSDEIQSWINGLPRAIEQEAA